MFRLASADCVKLTLLDKVTAAERRRWAVKHDEQEKADLKAAAHTSHIPPWPFARKPHKMEIHYFTWLASSSREHGDGRWAEEAFSESSVETC